MPQSGFAAPAQPVISLQFAFYNFTYIAVIAHFLDSAKEREWTDVLYDNNFIAWFLSSLVILAIPLIGIVPLYLQTSFGQIWCIVVAIGGLSGYGYHKVMHMMGKSEVCLNRTSYSVMYVLNTLSITLLTITVYNFFG